MPVTNLNSSRVRKSRMRLACFLTGFALTLTGCGQYPLTPGTAETSDDAAYQGDLNAPLVGLAISGGGDRSALYASYVIELLGSVPVLRPNAGSPTAGHESFLNEVHYISSVSGGSFAAAYFGTKQAAKDYGAMITDQSVLHVYNDYFPKFHQAMATDWQTTLFTGLGEMSVSGSNAKRLRKAIEDAFLDKSINFQTLHVMEQSGRSPYLIFNAANYNNGRRFVMTTIPQNEFCLDINKLVAAVAEGKDVAAKDVGPGAVAACEQSPFTPDGFDFIQGPDGKSFSVESGGIPLSQAVATSGAFPFFVGPIPYSVPGYDGYLHLADGGLTDNSGVESVAQLFLRKFISNEKQLGLILEINAGFPFDSTGSRVIHETTPATALANDPSRLSDIQEMRASEYRHQLWTIAKKVIFDEQKRVKSDPRTDNPVSRLDVLVFTHTELFEGLSEGDFNTIKITIGSKTYSAKEAEAALADLRTEYKVEPEEDDLLRVAACWSVHRHAPDIQNFFNELAHGARAVDPVQVIPVDERIKEKCPELDKSGALTYRLTPASGS